ncbi:hypothetical protein SFC50_03035 [Bacillus infantis]|uniref:LpxL/LpxP family acyltransferase n=1 Tax=Bacillus infantis TaxID=324767 RepID=UPI003981A567
MSIIDFSNLIKFNKIWKSMPFKNVEDRQLLMDFTKKILLSENQEEVKQHEKDELTYLLKNHYPFFHLLSKEISENYHAFSNNKRLLWIYLSIALYNDNIDEVIDPEDLDKLQDVFSKEKSSSTPLILTPFHIGVHTLTAAIASKYIGPTVCMVNKPEFKLIDEWREEYLFLDESNNITMVPIPSQTSPLKFAKLILRGSTGIMFPEFSYGINQDFERVNFLGGTLDVPIGVYVLAKKFKANVLPIASAWDEKSKRLRFMVGETLTTDNQSQHQFLQLLFNQGENWVKTYPEQFYWDYIVEHHKGLPSPI